MRTLPRLQHVFLGAQQGLTSPPPTCGPMFEGNPTTGEGEVITALAGHCRENRYMCKDFHIWEGLRLTQLGTRARTIFFFVGRLGSTGVTFLGRLCDNLRRSGQYIHCGGRNHTCANRNFMGLAPCSRRPRTIARKRVSGTPRWAPRCPERPTTFGVTRIQ